MTAIVRDPLAVALIAPGGATRTLSVTELSMSYARHVVFEGIDCSFAAGELVGVFGPNGAGKSTLLKALLGLALPDRGGMQLDGRPVACDDFAYMPQRSDIDWDYPAIVREVVAMGGLQRAGWGRWWLRRPNDLDSHVQAALAQVGMDAMISRQIGELSGGQRQRILLARTLVRAAVLDTPALLLDEPFAAVDAPTEHVLWRELQRQRDLGRLVLVVHHDLSCSEKFDRVLLLGARRAWCGTPAAVLTPARLAAAFGGIPGGLHAKAVRSVPVVPNVASDPSRLDDHARRPASRAAA